MTGSSSHQRTALPGATTGVPEANSTLRWIQGTFPTAILLGRSAMKLTIDDARIRVVTHWAVNDQMRPQSIEKADALLSRFSKFSARFGVTMLADVDEAVVRRFVTARGRNRHGSVADAAIATKRLRRTILRGFYRTARELRLTWEDPARDIILPAASSNSPRPMTAPEGDLLFMHAWSGDRQTRHASVIALMLSGAHSSEVGHIVAADLDPRRSMVRAHGSVKYTPRDLPVTDRHMRALLARRDLLVSRLPGVPLDTLVLATGADGSDASKQARVCVTAREVLRWAGIDDVRPGSIAAAAGLTAFTRSRRIEDAALILGLSSLDAAANAIGWDWRRAQDNSDA